MCGVERWNQQRVMVNNLKHMDLGRTTVEIELALSQSST